jgi:hypothetical protein
MANGRASRRNRLPRLSVADRFEMAVVGGLLLRPVDGAFGAVDVERHGLAGQSRCRGLNQVCVQVIESSIVSLVGEGVRLEPMRGRGERDTGLDQ